MTAAWSASADLSARHQGSVPSPGEVAAAIGTDEKTLQRAELARAARRTLSLDVPRPKSGDHAPLDLALVDDGFARMERRLWLVDTLARLPERDREVLGLYFFEGLTQHQLGQRFGVSQMQVSRWIASALGRLRARMATVEDEGPTVADHPSSGVAV
ncbi:hypothetical protein BH23ACT2_BH23ACT2_31450 [soil metagenome]